MSPVRRNHVECEGLLLQHGVQINVRVVYDCGLDKSGRGACVGVWRRSAGTPRRLTEGAAFLRCQDGWGGPVMIMLDPGEGMSGPFESPAWGRTTARDAAPTRR
jgi:hypothetical protein